MFLQEMIIDKRMRDMNICDCNMGSVIHQSNKFPVRISLVTSSVEDIPGYYSKSGRRIIMDVVDGKGNLIGNYVTQLFSYRNYNSYSEATQLPDGSYRFPFYSPIQDDSGNWQLVPANTIQVDVAQRFIDIKIQYWVREGDPFVGEVKTILSKVPMYSDRGPFRLSAIRVETTGDMQTPLRILTKHDEPIPMKEWWKLKFVEVIK